jgi:translation initiation factor IF-1
MTDPPITASGLLLEQIGPILYRATLPNGKPVLAHLSKPLTDAGVSFAPGTQVHLELTPYDFDIARITGTTMAPEDREASG